MSPYSIRSSLTIHNLSSLIIYLYYTTHLVLCQGFINLSFGNSGRESNPPFQPTTRLSPKIVSGDQPSTVSVIKPNTLSLFILRKIEFHVNLLQETQQAAGVRLIFIECPIIRILSHSLPILYQIWQRKSRVY